MTPREPHEEWRDVVGYKGFYQVSDLGRVRSLDRETKYRDTTRSIRGKILKGSISATVGYLFVTLGRENVQQHKYIHTLVLEAFVGPRPPGMECCHGKYGRSSNCLSNLSWGTHRKNSGSDKRRDGALNRQGYKRIRVRRSDGVEFESIAEAARQNTCTRNPINYVCQGKQKSAGGYGWEYIK